MTKRIWAVPELPEKIPPLPPQLPEKIMGIPVVVAEWRTLPDPPLTLGDLRCYIKFKLIEKEAHSE